MEGTIENLITERGTDGFGSSNSDLIKLAKQVREIDTTELGGKRTTLGEAPQWPVIGELDVSLTNVSNPGFSATREKAMEVAEAVTTLAVLRERIDRGDLKGTRRELAAFDGALRVIINHL